MSENDAKARKPFPETRGPACSEFLAFDGHTVTGRTLHERVCGFAPLGRIEVRPGEGEFEVIVRFPDLPDTGEASIKAGFDGHGTMVFQVTIMTAGQTSQRDGLNMSEGTEEFLRDVACWMEGVRDQEKLVAEIQQIQASRAVTS